MPKPVREGYIFLGWSTTPEGLPDDEALTVGPAPLVTEKTIYAVWEKMEPINLPSVLGENVVKVSCISNSEHKDRLYGLLNNGEDVKKGEIYYSEEKGSYLCDITVNGNEYVKEYSKEMDTDDIKHYLVKDNEEKQQAIYDMDTQKTITLYYDESKREWKVLNEVPIIFKVRCKKVMGKANYKENHEYYFKNEKGEIVLDGKYSTTNEIELSLDEIKKVGVSDEVEKVDIEIEKRPNYILNGKNYTYEYFENSGSIILGIDDTKEITLKYIREVSKEKIELEVEKLWDDNNDLLGKRPKSVILQVKRDGILIDECEVSSKNNFKHKFILPKYDELGNEISYTVDEAETTSDYVKEIRGTTVINRLMYELPDTSDINVFMYVLIFFISIIGIIVGIIFVRKSKSQK